MPNPTTASTSPATVYSGPKTIAQTPQPMSATALRAFLESEGMGQQHLSLIDSMPENSTANQAVARLQGGDASRGIAPLQHRYIERAIAFVNSDGNPPAEPKRAWDEKPAKPGQPRDSADTPARRKAR